MSTGSLRFGVAPWSDTTQTTVSSSARAASLPTIMSADSYVSFSPLRQRSTVSGSAPLIGSADPMKKWSE